MMDEAEKHLSMLDSNFGDIRRDVRSGLRCRLHIARGEYSEALSLSERLVDKSSPYYQIIRYDALRGMLVRDAITGEKRDEYEMEIRVLEEGLGPEPKFDMPELDRSSA